MEISELKEKRDQLEKDINYLVSEFVRETKVEVAEIKVKYEGGYDDEIGFPSIGIELNLPK